MSRRRRRRDYDNPFYLAGLAFMLLFWCSIAAAWIVYAVLALIIASVVALCGKKDAAVTVLESIAWWEKKKPKQKVVIQPPARSRHIRNDVKIAVSIRDGGKCRFCGSTVNLQFDHIIPYSKGGSSEVNNIQLLCGHCNLKKSNNY